MVQLIDKSAVVAEIEARINDIKVSMKAGLTKKHNGESKILLFTSILSFLDTLEVKEVDLDSIVDEAFERYETIHGCESVAAFNRAELYSFIKKILGLNARKW